MKCLTYWACLINLGRLRHSTGHIRFREVCLFKSYLHAHMCRYIFVDKDELCKWYRLWVATIVSWSDTYKLTYEGKQSLPLCIDLPRLFLYFPYREQVISLLWSTAMTWQCYILQVIPWERYLSICWVIWQ